MEGHRGLLPIIVIVTVKVKIIKREPGAGLRSVPCNRCPCPTTRPD